MKAEKLKLIVQEKYGQIAKKGVGQTKQSCCGTQSCCGETNINMSSGDYAGMAGYNADADLGLGCGIPTQFAGINKGDNVLDLGSGAGNDCFVARAIVGDTGCVTGLDFTEEMVERATENNKKLGYSNVRFVKGDIEEMPLEDNKFDVVVSNCVLNLVPDKNKAFAQIMRVLKPSGHFCVSDVVTKGNLPKKVKEDAEMYVGCVSGAIDMDKYVKIISDQGFQNITIHKNSEIEIPEEIMKKGDAGIFSITVSAYKPS